MTKQDYLMKLMDAYKNKLSGLSDTKEIAVSTGDLRFMFEYLNASLQVEEETTTYNLDDIEACFDCSLPIFIKNERQHIFFRGSIYAVCDSCWNKQRYANLLEYHQLKYYSQFVKENNLEEQFERYLQNNL